MSGSRHRSTNKYQNLGDDKHTKASPSSSVGVIGGLIGCIFFTAVVYFAMYAGESVSGENVETNSLGKYAIVLDAGSTGSRIHVYEFDGSGALVDELFEQLKPGLSSYAKTPTKAGESLRPLMNSALKRIPQELHRSTQVFLGATAGLRLLPGNQAKVLLDNAEALLEIEYPFPLANDKVTGIPPVSILDGSDEGKFAWVAANYLLGRTTSTRNTVAVSDLGGGSVQLIKALPYQSGDPEGYTTTVDVSGHKFSLYTHSYLGYGLMAGRMKVLQAGGVEGCMPKGFQGTYEYGDETIDASARGKSASSQACTAATAKALRLEAPCPPGPKNGCSFDGVWAGRATQDIHLASYFYERIEQADAGTFQKDKIGTTDLAQLKRAAHTICQLSNMEIQGLKDEMLVRPLLENVKPEDSYLCLDLTYIYTMLSQGFGIQESETISLVKAIEYKGSPVEAAWALGVALTLV